MPRSPGAHAPLGEGAIACPEGKAAIVDALQEGRERTWLLASGLDDVALREAVADYLSPPVWDLGHMANFEEQWLVQRLADRAELRGGHNDTYNAFAHPRAERPTLSLMDRDGCRAYMEEVRREALQVLDAVDIGPRADRLTRRGFVHWMLVLHEHQHQETLMQTMQMRGAIAAERRWGPGSPEAHGGFDIPVKVRRLPQPDPTRLVAGPTWIDVPAGVFEMGRPHGPMVYDNEAPPHEVDVDACQIARLPVTCGDYLGFVEAGGYQDRALWSDRGLAWLDAQDHHAPLYWRQTQDEGWVRIGPGCHSPIDEWPDVILNHVTYFEAQAYAAWVGDGARLPTEAEWEKAARYDPRTGRSRAVGLATTRQANIDQLAFAPSRAGAYPAGASPLGVEQMIGDVWEWCASGLEPYPGFEAFPYDEYSQVFFGGDHRILRGGSWATRAPCATPTFRNWDHPYRRQIFSGIRLARDG